LEALSRRLPVEYFSRALVEHILIGAELLIRNQRQVGAFWEVVADAIVLTLTGGFLVTVPAMGKRVKRVWRRCV